jgi:hypothetical protein
LSAIWSEALRSGVIASRTAAEQGMPRSTPRTLPASMSLTKNETNAAAASLSAEDPATDQNWLGLR